MLTVILDNLLVLSSAAIRPNIGRYDTRPQYVLMCKSQDIPYQGPTAIGCVTRLIKHLSIQLFLERDIAQAQNYSGCMRLLTYILKLDLERAVRELPRYGIPCSVVVPGIQAACVGENQYWLVAPY